MLPILPVEDFHLEGEEDITSELSEEKNVPHVLVSKMGTLSDQPHIFNGEVYVQG